MTPDSPVLAPTRPDPRLFSVGSTGDLLVNAIERHARRTALVCRDQEISYLELGRQISRTLQTFQSIGLQRGDAVMQLTANRHEMVVVMAAAYLGGYVSVIPNYSNGFDDHRYMLEDSGAALLIVDAARADRAAQLHAATDRPLKIWCHDEGTALPAFWPAAARHAPQALVAVDRPDDIIRLIYTGGTTGRPKGVITLSGALAFASLLHISEQGFDTRTRLLASSPLSHGAGSMLIPVLYRGGQVVIHEKFDPQRILEAVDSSQASTLYLVPTMLYALMDHPLITRVNLSGLERILYTASPIIPTRLRQALNLFGPILHQNYGQTEVPGTILSLTQDDHLDPRGDKLTSAGRPYPCVSVRLIDDNGQPVRRGGGVGELCVRAPHVTVGYWNKPEASAELLRDGWLHTGDLAYEDNDGYFHIVDRKKDMIISGGFNIYPQEIEQILTSHPAVTAAAVIGVPDPKWGEAVKAIVVVKTDQAVDGEELIALVKARKGPTMAPKSVEFVAVLPLTEVGKVDKKTLRAMHRAAG